MFVGLPTREAAARDFKLVPFHESIWR